MIGVCPHQADNAVFGRGVTERAGITAADADQTGRGADQHYRAAVALLDQTGHRHLDRVVHAGEVDIDDVSPAVGARLHRRDAGVGDDDVETAELVEPGLQRAGQRSLIANIGLARDDSRTGVFDKLDRGGQIISGGHRIGHRRDLVADVDRDDVRAVGRQPDRLGTALTAGGAGDERDFACERGHRCSHFLARALVRDAAGPWPGRPRRRVAAS